LVRMLKRPRPCSWPLTTLPGMEAAAPLPPDVPCAAVTCVEAIKAEATNMQWDAFIWSFPFLNSRWFAKLDAFILARGFIDAKSDRCSWSCKRFRKPQFGLCLDLLSRRMHSRFSAGNFGRAARAIDATDGPAVRGRIPRDIEIYSIAVFRRKQ
jgi:hypothetical protein